jgi:hypothetical protein
VRLVAFCVAIAAMLLPVVVVAMPSCSVTFSEEDLGFSEYVHDDDTFDGVGLSGTSPLLGPAGFPSLPTKRFYVLMPQDRRCVSLNITDLDTASLSGQYYMLPCQLPKLTNGSPPAPFVEPDSTAYGSTTLYPDGFATLVGEGFCSGYKLALIEIHPVRYVAAERRLVFCSSMHITLNLEQCENLARPVYRRSELAQQHVEKTVRAIVVNPEDVAGYSLGYGFHIEGRSSPGRLTVTELPSVEGNPVDYVVITSAALAGAFDSIIDWRTRRGQVAALRTVEWINANYPGCDIQERIRNFIIDANSSWGTNWVLLGGDKDVVPVRWTSPDQDEPSDLYYAELDGNWNILQNAYFGDTLADLADQTLTADVCLGRLPVWDTAQVASFWDKLQAYEKQPDPDPDYIHGILMAGGSFDRYGDGMGAANKDQRPAGQGAEGLQLLEWFDSCGFRKVYELYGPRLDPNGQHIPPWWEGDAELTNASFTAAFETGYQFINHMDHGSPSVLGTGQKTGGGNFTKTQAAALHNGVNPSGGSRYSILWTFGCSTGALDHANIGQTLINNPDGGCIAYVGSSRPGCFSGQVPQDQAFYEALFVNDLTDVGSAACFAQHQVIDNEYLLRFAKTMNLYGDPSMPVWTDGPYTLGAGFISEIQLGPQDFMVDVTANGVAVSGALVTLLMRDDYGQVELYARDTTTYNGTVTFAGLCPEDTGVMRVTVTKQNFLPLEDSCEVLACTSAYLHYKAIVAVDDDSTGVSFGNGDGIVNPGEHVELTIRIENTGGQTATGITGILATSDPFVEVLQCQDSFEDITPGQTAKNITSFVFSVDSNRTADSVNPCEIAFAITIASDQDTWSDDFRIMVMRDSLVLGGHRITVVSSDTFVMDSLAVTNYGWGAAAGVTAVLTSNNSSYVVDGSIAEFDDIAGQSTGISTGSFRYHLNTGAPGNAPDFTLRLSDRYGRTWDQQIDLVPPDSPGTPWLVLGGDHYLTIGWPKSDSSDLRGYNVYRRHDTIAGTWQLASGMLVDSSATFRDQGLSPYTVYQYKVAAVDFSGNESGLSDALTTMTTPTYLSGWPVHTACGDGQRTSGVCGNIIGDDKLEVVAVMGDSIYAWSSDGHVLSGWPKGLGIASWSTPALGDLDGDGLDDVVLGVNDGRGLSAWSGDGGLLWYVDDSFTGSTAIADVNQDGSLEVIGATADGYMHIWNASGSPLNSWLLGGSGTDYRVHGSPAVADLYPDSAGLEIVVIAMESDTTTSTPFSSAVFCYPSNGGTALWCTGNPGATLGWGADRNSPVIADLNGDGKLEIVETVSGGSASEVRILDRDGDTLDDLGGINSGIYDSSAYYGAPWACPAIGDIDGDSLPEIVLTLSARYVNPYYCNRSCLAAWKWNAGDTWSLMDSFEIRESYENCALAFGTSPTIADVDGNGTPEVIVGSWDDWKVNDRIRAFRFENEHFEEVLSDGFPIYGVDFPEQDFVVTDLDLDGDMELLAFMCTQGVVHAWDFPVKGDRRNVEWNGFHGDVRHTGLYAQPVGGTFENDAYWWGRYKLWGDLAVDGYDLVVQPGTWVQARRRWTAVTGIEVDTGVLAAGGTPSAPTYFEPEIAGDTWDGLRVNNGRASVVGCLVTGATEGLAVTGCDSLRVLRDSFTDCRIGGITSLCTPVTSVESSYFTGNGSYDVYVREAFVPNSVLIAGNSFMQSANYGVWIDSTPVPTIVDNTMANTPSWSQYGIRCTNVPPPPEPVGCIRHNTITGYGQGGILCEACSPSIGGNDIVLNAGFGLTCLDGANPAVESTLITNHYVGVMAGLLSSPDLGRVPPTEPSGYNSIYYNSSFNVVNANPPLPPMPVWAQNNWWGQSPPDPTKFSGPVFYTPWLDSPPGDGMQAQPVARKFPLDLSQGRPNPFTSATRLMLSNPRQQRLDVGMYDVSGRLVRKLLGAVAPPGTSWLSWDGRDSKGRKVGAGVYFCRLIAGNEKRVSRVVYVRGK